MTTTSHHATGNVNAVLDRAMHQLYASVSDAPTEPCISMKLCRIGEPIQFGLRTTRRVKRGDFLCYYGGKLCDKSEVRASNVCKSHMRAIPDSMYVLDGGVIAARVARPILLVSTISPEDEAAIIKQAFAAIHDKEPLGWLCNSPGSHRRGANATIQQQRILNGLAMVPVVRALRDIEAGEEVTCVYGNEHNWASSHGTSGSNTSSHNEPVSIGKC